MLLALPSYVLNKYCLKPFFPSTSGSFKLNPVGLFMLMVFNCFLVLAFVCHLRCWLSDAGKTPKIEPWEENCNVCNVCKQPKPKRTHHCSVCKVCVHRLDHHCVWVNNCVGALNQKYFILFLFYTALSSAISLIIIALTVFMAYGQKFGRVDIIGIVSVVFVTFESILFLFFTGDFLMEQLESVRDNQTCIESYQFKRGVSKDPVKNFEDVFGKTFWLWLFPVRPDLTVNFLEEIIIQKLPENPKEKPKAS